MATQDPKLRASYLVVRKGHEIANYHRNLVKGVRTLLAIMGKRHIAELSRKDLTYKTNTGEIYFDVDRYLAEMFNA
jgi:glutamate synthase domain-containing protein 2